MIKIKYRSAHSNRHWYEITWICDAQRRSTAKNRYELFFSHYHAIVLTCCKHQICAHKNAITASKVRSM
jgi:hypothetical protein